MFYETVGDCSIKILYSDISINVYHESLLFSCISNNKIIEYLESCNLVIGCYDRNTLISNSIYKQEGKYIKSKKFILEYERYNTDIYGIYFLFHFTCKKEYAKFMLKF